MDKIKLAIYGCVIGHFIQNVFTKLTFNGPCTHMTQVVIKYVEGQSDPTVPHAEVLITLYPGDISFDDYRRFLLHIATIQTAPGWRMAEAEFREGALVSADARNDMSGLERCLLNRGEVNRFKNEYINMAVPIPVEHV